MKSIRLLLPTLAVAGLTFLITGCDRPNNNTTQAPARVEVQPPATSPAIQDYTYAQKAEFTAAMRTQLADINRDMDQLESKIENSNDTVKAEAKTRLQSLRSKATQLERNLDGVQETTESTWDSFKAGSKTAYVEVVEGLTQARQWVSDKIAP